MVYLLVRVRTRHHFGLTSPSPQAPEHSHRCSIGYIMSMENSISDEEFLGHYQRVPFFHAVSFPTPFAYFLFL
jgi:hypothetical protein